MFFASLKSAWRRVGVRLTVFTIGILLVSFLSFYGVIYVLLQSTLTKADHFMIRDEVRDYTDRVEDDGLDRVIKEETTETEATGEGDVMVRIADAANKTLFLNVPLRWSGFDIAGLEDPHSVRLNQWITLRKKGHRDRLEIFAVALPGGDVLQVGRDSHDRNQALKNFQGLLASAGVFALALAFLASLVLTFRLLRPIHRLLDTVQWIHRTNRFTARVPVGPGNDELSDLGRLFNQMLERIERLVSEMRQALDHVAHDLRTPLARIRGVAETALQSERPHDVCQDALADCLEDADDIRSTLNSLMDLSEAEAGTLRLNRERLAVSDLIADVLDLYGPVADEKGVVMEGRCGDDVVVDGDAVRLRQALANLIDNAVKYTPAGGRVDVEAHQRADSVWISVRDTGIGIPAHDMPRIWERLFRGDRSRSEPGLGLGLSLVKAIILAHAGEVSVESGAGGGSVFTIRLPLAVERAAVGA